MRQFTGIFVIFFSLYIPFQALSQRPYWQQRVEYKMEIDVDHKKHQFTGKQELTYFNNSPDTLTKVFYHLYYNAFQPSSVMDIRSRSIPDQYMNRVSTEIIHLKGKEQGFQKILSLSQDGKSCTYHIEGTILEVTLAQPLLPGGKTVLNMNFFAQVPKLMVRSGRNNEEGVDYSMAQWYPKLCAYDDQGWHANPYIGREFYGEFGLFDVKISIDKKFTLGGTGYLQNPQEVGKGYEDPSKPLITSKNKKLTWHFIAPDVHDFAWAADPDYVHTQMQANDSLTLHFLHLKTADAARWNNLAVQMVKMFGEMARRYGTYPYKQFSFIQGGDGGMEYPMATLITDDGGSEALLAVSIHEAIHNWYYGVLGSNESKYPFMDEGFTTWASSQMEDYLAGSFAKNPASDAYYAYFSLVTSKYYEPLTTHSDFYKTAMGYEYAAYYVGVVFVDQVRYLVGNENFNTGMKQYFETWKFKHPRPGDFIRIMEKVSGMELDWYLEQFTGTLNTVDYSVKSIKKEGEKTTVTLERIGKFPMPLDISIKQKDGTTQLYYIPLDVARGIKSFDVPATVLNDWQWVNPTYTFTLDIPYEQISSILIDPEENMIDINTKNNRKSLP